MAAPSVDDRLQARIDALTDAIREIGPLVVAFSGGVDSALLTVAAARALGPDKVLAATADSASLGSGELATCRRLTSGWGVDWVAVSTDELADERYLANDTDRCYWCKSALMDQLEPLATERGATVALGVNVDDLGDHRPGQQAAGDRGARFPLVEAGLTKDDIRALARHWDVEVWDRPAMPCLSSRIPYGTAVTVPLLSRIDRAEAAVRALGFSDLRVRHYGDTARIELPRHEMVQAVERSEELVAAVTGAGYRYATLDLAGLRSGNLNHVVEVAAEPIAGR
ncbi:MAG: ATP-dependent sacrificial sulfur transferase LarE [Actinomycetota bacterium]